ncbi:hypothetical protein BDA96_09G079100 [Sorghum bicolor]|uniref:Uncharacterized protein n=1 Tax=Sorghum bicolor TaxID=4558 RepID=A0A921QBG4_SORBI|nr:hypothetical protein BDA96_09G079100 [Sorghum bicolor]
MKILDWSKILGSEYRSGYHYGAGGVADWSELDDNEDSVDWVPPHELVVGRRRAVSLSLNGVVGKMLKVRDAVWKQTTR